MPKGAAKRPGDTLPRIAEWRQGVDMKKATGILMGLMASSVIADAGLAQIRTDPPADPRAADGDIIVTAQRREERLIDVPIAVSAVNAAGLERAGVQNLNNAQALIPNIQINQTPGNSFSPLISIRGLAPAADTSLARDQPVGIYLDGVPVAKSTGAAFDTVDLERIEVLRGPQGTLYGKNTIGGAVNMITRPPSGEFGGQIYLSYGSWGEFRRRTSVDLPAVGGFKVKIGYSGRDTGGYWHNAATRKDFGEQSLNAGRIDILWEPTATVSARYAYDISDAIGTPALLALSAPGSLPATSPFIAGRIFADRPGRNAVSADNARQSDFRTTGHALTLQYAMGDGALGDVVLKSITARRTLQTRSKSDFDGTPTDLIRFILNNDYHAFSQEVQVIGTGAQVKYTLGGFYLKDRYHAYNPRWNFQFGADRYDLSDRSGGSRSIAGYGQLTWTPAFTEEKLDLSVGLRWTKDRKQAEELFLSNTAYATNPAAAGSGVFERLANGTPVTRSGRPAAGARPGAGGIGPYDLIPLDQTESWSQFNPEFNLVYKLQPDWTVYGRIATGFKSGGINDTASTNGAFNTPYDPEKLLSFEGGTKLSALDHRLNLSLAVYHSIYKNFQAGVFVPELVTTNIINAGKAKFTGVEIEGALRPIAGLTINFGGGYLDARYTDFVLPTGVDVTDSYKIPLAPKWNYLIGSSYAIPLGGMRLEISGNWSWRSMQWATITPNQLATRRAYGTLDGRIALTDIDLGGGNSLEVALWGRNITDTEYWNSGIDLGTFAVRQWAEPVQRLRHGRQIRAAWASKPASASDRAGRGRMPDRRLSRLAFSTLFAVTMATAIGNLGLVTVMPAIGRALAIPDALIASIFSLSALAWAVTAPLWGRVSDRRGRKPMILVGLGGFIASMAGCGLVVLGGLHGFGPALALFAAFTLIRCCYGLFGSAAGTAAQAYVADHSEGHARVRALSALAGALSLGTIIGPTIAPFLTFAPAGLAGPMFAFALMGMLLVALVGLVLEPDPPIVTRGAPARPRQNLWADRSLRPILIFGIMVASAQAINTYTLGFAIIDTTGLAARKAQSLIGMAMSAGAASGLVAQIGVVNLWRPTPAAMLRWGALLVAIGNGVVIGIGGFAALAAGVALACFGYGLARPGFSSILSLALGPERQGAAAGAVNMIAGASITLPPIIAVACYQYYWGAPFILSALSGALVFGATLRRPAAMFPVSD